MDWDLEAPGLHRFFSAKAESREYDGVRGVVNYFSDLRDALARDSKLYGRLTTDDPSQRIDPDQVVPLDNCIIPDVLNGVDFMRAGRFDSRYANLVASI